jgi:hypothetical protein
MIRYALACNKAHPFESWVSSSEAFDAQRAQGLLTCPACGSAEVETQIMAPSVARTDKTPARLQRRSKRRRKPTADESQHRPEKWLAVRLKLRSAQSAVKRR